MASFLSCLHPQGKSCKKRLLPFLASCVHGGSAPRNSCALPQSITADLIGLYFYFWFPVAFAIYILFVKAKVVVSAVDLHWSVEGHVV